MMRLIGCVATIAISLYLISSCIRLHEPIEPKISYGIQDRYLQNLASNFQPLSSDEIQTDWGSEYRIADGFAKELDLYRAITCYRRASFLVPQDKQDRLHEMQYQTLLGYYLGKRYSDVEKSFTQSSLSQIRNDFSAFHDLLVILDDTYFQLDLPQQRQHVHRLLVDQFPDTANHLEAYFALQTADFPTLKSHQSPAIQTFLSTYQTHQKSPPTAALLNAILPGCGYFYLGMIQTSITAFLVNLLFIAAALYAFRKKAIALAIIVLGFEAGWYMGGVQGGITHGRTYNEALYEAHAKPLMNREGYFPVYQLKNGF